MSTEELELSEQQYEDMENVGLRRRSRSTGVVNYNNGPLPLPPSLVEAKAQIKEVYPDVDFTPPFYDNVKGEAAVAVLDIAGDLESLQRLVSSYDNCTLSMNGGRLILVHRTPAETYDADEEEEDNSKLGKKTTMDKVKLSLFTSVALICVVFIYMIIKDSNFGVLLT